MRARWSLRPATVADVGHIALVWHLAWQDGHTGHVPDALYAHRTLDAFRERVPSRISATTVATIESAGVVGFVTVHDDEIEQMFVAEAARGTGLAAALLARGEATIATRYPRTWLAVVAGNTRARRFYERCGWSDEGALDYAAQIGGGTINVPCRRYAKRLTATGK